MINYCTNAIKYTDSGKVEIRVQVEKKDEKNAILMFAVTADAMEGVREELLSKGMDDYLTKPIVVEELYQMIRKWLPEEKWSR